MWLLLSNELLGNLEAGTFLMMRTTGEGGASLEIVHINLLQPAEVQELPLLRGDEATCVDAFELLTDDLEADDALFRLLGAETDEADSSHGPGAWLELNEHTLLNLGNSAVVMIAEEDGAFGVVYGASNGSLALYAGSEDEADAYLNALATVLGASDALVEAESESDLRSGPFGALLSRAKKGQA
jgi:hypothetical protein